MKKHWLFTTLIALALCVICCVLFSTEAKAARISDLTFTRNEIGQGYTVSGCNPLASGELEIPAVYNGLEVTDIGKDAFAGCSQLTSITIPNSVTNIDYYAFIGCSNLSTVYIGRQVKNIGYAAFCGCENLRDVYFYGTELGWERIYISFLENTALFNANLHCLGFVFGLAPVSTSACDGEYATVKASASGDGLTYTWYYKDTDDADFTKCTSSTGDTYKVKMSSSLNGRQVYCQVTDAYGNTGETYPVTLTLKIIEKLAITKQLVSAKAYAGETISLELGATGESPTYAWFYKTKNSSEFVKSSYLKTNICNVEMCDENDGLQFYCQVTDKYGNTVKSNTVTLTLIKKATIIEQPQTQKIKCGKVAKLTVEATGTGLKYQWQYSTNNKNWKNCSSNSAKKETLAFTAKTNHSNNYYRCKVSDDNGNTVYTDVVRLYVLSITTQPKTANVTVSETIEFNVDAIGADKTYQWQTSTDGKNWENSSSASARKAMFRFISETSHNGNYYRCKITDSAGNVVYTNKVRAYVLGITTQPKTQKVEVGEKIKFTVKATGAGLKYQWQVSSNGKSWKNCASDSAKKASFSFTGKTSHNGNYYRCKVTDSAGNVVYTSKVRAYVLGIEKQPAKKTVIASKTAKFSVEATGHSLKYQWQYSTDGGKTWKNCSSSAAKKAIFSFKTKTSHNSNYYRCKITDSAKNVIYTSKVKLTIKK